MRINFHQSSCLHSHSLFRPVQSVLHQNCAHAHVRTQATACIRRIFPRALSEKGSLSLRCRLIYAAVSTSTSLSSEGMQPKQSHQRPPVETGGCNEIKPSFIFMIQIISAYSNTCNAHKQMTDHFIKTILAMAWAPSYNVRQVIK